MSKAACDWVEGTGRHVAQLTLLDPVCVHHRIIFRWFHVTQHVCHVEHYWSGGRSGVGRYSFRRDIHNERVWGFAPFACWLAPRGNHAYVVEWYYDSIRCGCGSGFPRGLRCFNQNCR